MYVQLGNEKIQSGFAKTLNTMKSEPLAALYNAMPNLLKIMIENLNDTVNIDFMEVNKTSTFSITRDKVVRC